MASIKKKRVSKKNKAAWRKHTDVKDVEDFLEEQRQEERIGKFSEKKDEELFKIDAVPNKRVVLSQKQKRKANALKPLRSLSALENTSKVQDPIVKRNHVKPKRSGRNIEEEILHPKTQRHIQANKDRLKYNEKLSKKLSKRRTAKDFTKDIWQEEDVRERAPGLTDTWISKDLALYTLRNIGKASIKVHDSIRHKTIKTKSFSAPHPGMSYNPSLKAHQDLISSVVEKEKGIIKVEKHLKRVTTEMFSKVTPEQRDELHRKEMSSGLAVEDGGEEEDDNDGTKQDENNVPYKAINPPVENKKKSKQQRRKQKEQKVLTNEMLKKKELKQQRIDLHRIKKIVAEVDEEAEDLNKLKKHRKQVAEKKKFETKRLGRLKFQEPDQDVNMPEDIAGNLRNVKTESSLLVDRFKNFQQRNILPTSVEVNKTKRRKIKRFPRSTHKEPGVSITKKKK